MSHLVGRPLEQKFESAFFINRQPHNAGVKRCPLE